ncbi:phage tail tape measure protein, partial [Paenibacillus xylanilyticus]
MAENENIGGIEAKLGLDADGFKKGIEEAKEDMEKMKDTSKKFNQDFRSVSKTLRDVGVDSKEIRKIKTEMLASKPEVFEKQLKNVESQLRAIGANSSQIAKVKEQILAQSSALDTAGNKFGKVKNEILQQGNALETTSGKLSKLKTELDESAKSASNLSKEISTAGIAYTAYAAAVAAALTKAVDLSAQFEQAMAKVKAISGATAQEFEKLRQQAIDLGATTVFSSTQAAEAQSFLAMAGFKTKEIMEAMPGVLSLAAAGQMEIARTADIASN